MDTIAQVSPARLPMASANPTDVAIYRLLAAGPLPTAALAARLGIPARTIRHRLHRLRQAGVVASYSDGVHGLVMTSPARIAEPLPALAVPVTAARIAEPLPALAVPVTPTEGPAPRFRGPQGARTVLAAAALGLAVAGGIALMVRMHRMLPPPSPAPASPLEFGVAWGWKPGPTW